MDDLPPELLAQLSALPEDAPADFMCAICLGTATNRWSRSPRDYERPPICKSCESVTGHAWNGTARHRTGPTGGSFRDRRNAMRIIALAEALAHEAASIEWSNKHAPA